MNSFVADMNSILKDERLLDHEKLQRVGAVVQHIGSAESSAPMEVAILKLELSNSKDKLHACQLKMNNLVRPRHLRTL